jgi:hypothetical protein
VLGEGKEGPGLSSEPENLKGLPPAWAPAHPEGASLQHRGTLMGRGPWAVGTPQCVATGCSLSQGGLGHLDPGLHPDSTGPQPCFRAKSSILSASVSHQ